MGWGGGGEPTTNKADTGAYDGVRRASGPVSATVWSGVVGFAILQASVSASVGAVRVCQCVDLAILQADGSMLACHLVGQVCPRPQTPTPESFVSLSDGVVRMRVLCFIVMLLLGVDARERAFV